MSTLSSDPAEGGPGSPIGNGADRHSTDVGNVPATASLDARRIGIPALVFMIIAASAPLTVVAGGVPSNFAVTGLVGILLSFVVLGIILILFAIGYAAMSRHVHNAGAFFAYISDRKSVV